MSLVERLYKQAVQFAKSSIVASRHSSRVVIVASLFMSGCASVAPQESATDGNFNSLDSFQIQQRAEQAYQQSRWLEAVSLYQSLVEKNPSDSGAWFRLGNIFAQQGSFQRAISAYETSLSHDADQPKAWFNLSTAYLLNAQSAMRGAHNRLRDGDPAKAMIEQRLSTLSVLVHGRLEEGVAPAAYR